jgi:LL-diaminopimelate aminotransferase
MKIITAKRMDAFPEYIFARLNREVAKVEKKTGRKVLNFGAGSPDIPPSKKYIDKLSEFVQAPNAHTYPGYGATAEFRDALIAWHKGRGVSLEQDEVYPLCGEKQAIALLPLAFLDEGDEVLVPDPGYPGYAGAALISGAKIVYYNLTEANKYKIDSRELKAKITKKTKFIWVNFPSNPLGHGTTLEELKKIVNIAKKHNIFIVYDNAYSEITYDNYIAPSILQIAGAKKVAVEINSFSKSLSLAGYRIGWIMGNKDIIAALAKIKSQMDSGLSLPLQRLGAYALNHPDKTWQKNMLKSYKDRRNIVADYLTTLGLEFTLPKAGLYIWAKIPDTEKNAEDFTMKLLQKRQILLTPGNAFGENGDRFVRVSFCVNIDEIKNYF